MPFTLNAELELNVIWLGNPMPENQLVNLVNMLLNNPKVQFNIWVNSDERWNDFKERIAVIVNNFFNENKAILAKKKITKADIYSKLCPKKLTPASMQLPTEFLELFKVLEEAGLWATISDIARLLILSRTNDLKARHARVFIETDNQMMPEFWSFAFGKKDVGAVYTQEVDGEELFPPESIRGDCIFIDVESTKGKIFAESIRAHLLKVFTDPMIEAYIKALLIHATVNKGLHPGEVRTTFGMLPTTILRMHFMTTEKETLFGMKNIIIPKGELQNLIRHGCYRGAKSSWEQEDKPILMRAIVSNLFFLRLAELSDVSGIITAKIMLEELKKFPGRTVENKQDYLNLLQVVVRKENQNVIPEWLAITVDNNKKTATPAPYFKA